MRRCTAFATGLAMVLMGCHGRSAQFSAQDESAVRAVIAAGETVTYDLGGSAGTREFGEAVAARVRAA